MPRCGYTTYHMNHGMILKCCTTSASLQTLSSLKPLGPDPLPLPEAMCCSSFPLFQILYTLPYHTILCKAYTAIALCVLIIAVATLVSYNFQISTTFLVEEAPWIP